MTGTKRADELQPGDRVFTLGSAMWATVGDVSPYDGDDPRGAGHLAISMTDSCGVPTTRPTVLYSLPAQPWDLATDDALADYANRVLARFHPQESDDERPAIEVDGALVAVYWEGRTLRVSVDTDNAPAWSVGLDGECAVRVDVEDGTVSERSAR